jgi:hypothetical protein
VAAISVADGDAFDQGAKDLCRFRARSRVLKRTVKVGNLLSVDLGKLGVEARRWRSSGCDRDP